MFPRRIRILEFSTRTSRSIFTKGTEILPIAYKMNVLELVPRALPSRTYKETRWKHACYYSRRLMESSNQSFRGRISEN